MKKTPKSAAAVVTTGTTTKGSAATPATPGIPGPVFTGAPAAAPASKLCIPAPGEVLIGRSSDAATPAASAPVSAWDLVINPFAAAIGKTPAEVTGALKSLVGEPGDAALALLQNEEDTPTADVTEALKGLNVPKAVLNKTIKGLRKKEEVAPIVTGLTTGNIYSILPQVPDEESFTNMLKTGGVLEVGITEVIAGIRATIADEFGLFDLDKKILQAMENHSRLQKKPCTADYYQIRKEVLRKGYSEIFAALDIEGASITAPKRAALISSLKQTLWPALNEFHKQVIAWNQTYQQQTSNPAMLINAVASAFQGVKSGMAAAIAIPPTLGLRSQAESFIEKVNEVFAVDGMVIGRALAFDAQKIKKMLNNPALPVQTGNVDKEQMLKFLGANVPLNYVTMEQNVTQYAMGVMKFDAAVTPDKEADYVIALLILGNAIPWDTLTGSSDSSSKNKTSKF